MNKLKISIKKVLILISFVIINIFTFIASININNDDWICKFTIISIIQLISNILYLKILKYNIFSLPVLFIIFSYMFHFGHLILITFNIDVERSFDATILVSNETYRNACYFVMYSQIFLVLGIIVVNIFSDNKIKYDFRNALSYKFDDRERVFKIGFYLFIVGIIPTIYIDISRIIAYVQGNYLSTYYINVNSIITYLANLTQYGVIMMIIGRYDKKSFVNKVMTITIIYQVIIMLTGNRGSAIMLIISLVYIYINLVKNINKKQVIKFIVLGYIGIALINFIGETRMAEIREIDTLLGIFFESLTKSPLFELLGEFGSTMITLCYSIMFFPTVKEFACGTNYLTSLLIAIPGVSKFIGDLINEFVFINYFPSSYRAYLGGSYLGELYYSFGKLGVIFTVFIGIFIAYTSIKIKVAIYNKELLKLSIYMVVFNNILWWGRSYFSGLLRECIWTMVPIIVINYLIKQKHKSIEGGYRL